MKKTLGKMQNFGMLIKEQGMAGLSFIGVKMGYDGRAYLLFSSRIPPRINGMFVDTVANAEYSAIVITPSWENGSVKKAERIDFGKHKMNFHFLCPVPDGSFLLLGSRCWNSKQNGPEKNAVFVDRGGKVLREFTYGDGIADCIIRKDGTIITSYFDEGVYGNYGQDDPVGSSGLCAWNSEGEIIWRPERSISDCYAMITDDDGNLWYYYYTDFKLVCTDFKTEKEYNPEVKGARSFAAAGNGRYLIRSGGYGDLDSFFVSRIEDGLLTGAEPLEYFREDGTAVPGIPVAFHGAKAMVLTIGGNITFADFSEISEQ